MSFVWLLTLADFCVNLSAGWVGAAVIVSATAESKRRINWWILTGNCVMAIVSLLVAVGLRKWGGP